MNARSAVASMARRHAQSIAVLRKPIAKHRARHCSTGILRMEYAVAACPMKRIVCLKMRRNQLAQHGMSAYAKPTNAHYRQMA
jgi:hypothetical protein